jgi:hypothetical protein
MSVCFDYFRDPLFHCFHHICCIFLIRMKNCCFYNYLPHSLFSIFLFLFLCRLDQPGAVSVFGHQFMAFLDFYLFQPYFDQVTEIASLSFYQYINHLNYLH